MGPESLGWVANYKRLFSARRTVKLSAASVEMTFIAHFVFTDFTGLA